MKRIKNADINFKVNPKRINLNNFSMKFYTVNSEAYFFTKDQNNLVSVEREATIYDDPEVIISGGTVAVDYYLPLDWSELVQLGEGVLNYRCINNIEDPFFPDLVYNQVVEDTTGYYIDSDIIVDPSINRNIIERVTELESGLALEELDRKDADEAISGAVDTEVARAISAETELSERIDNIESGTSEALDNEIARAISAETAIRQDLTDESEIRSSADTAMWTAVTDEITRATSAETAIDNKVEVETLRAIGVENAISGNLETYKATNNAALQAETTRATSAETALQTAIGNEATARANADAVLDGKISAISGISELVTAETARATAAETALGGRIDAVSGAIDSISAATSGSVEELAAKIDTVSGNVLTEEARAKGVEDALSGAIDTLDVRFFDDAKYEDSGNTKVINFYNGNVVKATIDCTDFLVDGMIDDVRIETISGVTYLVIDFNTASGKEDIQIPLTDIFNPANYYTKSETSGATEISNALAEKLAISDFNTYSGAVDTAINSKAAQSTVDALSGTVTGHISDSTIHLTSGDVQSQIVSSISGKANSSDVYLKSETSGATELATAFAATQPKLIAGSGITIDTANTISCTVTGGGATYSAGTGINISADTITAVYDGHMSYDNPQNYVNNYSGELYIVSPWTDCSGLETGQCIFNCDSSDSYKYTFSFNPTTKQYEVIEYPEGKENDWQNYFTLEFVKKYGVFKLTTIQEVYYIQDYQCTRFLRIGNEYNDYSIKYSGTTEDAFNGVIDEINGCVYNVGLSVNTKEFGVYYNKINGEQSSTLMPLDDLKYDGALKTDINIPLGTSGWTSVDIGGTAGACENCSFQSLGTLVHRLTFSYDEQTVDYGSLGSYFQIGLKASGSQWYSETQTINFVESGSTYVPSVTISIFDGLEPTLNWDAITKKLIVSYPATYTHPNDVYGFGTYDVVVNCIGSNGCHMGTEDLLSGIEYYTELQQPIKPFVQQLRSDVNTISGQVATKQDVLVSGENIKTINNQSLLGSGNIDIQGGGGGKAVSAGTNISITTGETADTINCTLPISAGTGYLSFIGNGIIGGSMNSATGDCATAFGVSNKANGRLSFTIGGSNYGNGEYSFAGGSSSEAKGNTSFAFGYMAKAKGEYSIAIGSYFTLAENDTEVALGKANVSHTGSTDADKTLFSVGNGINTSNRHNAFEIRQNGDIYITKDGQDVKLQDHLGGGTGEGISSAECQTMIDNSISGKADSSDVYLKSETSGATELATAFAAKSDFSGSYNDLTDKPTIPTSTSQLTNDSGYITSSALNGYATEDYVTAATNDMATKTWVGQQGYLTQHQDISGKQDVSGMTAYTQNSVFAAYTAATNSALANKQNQLTAGSGISIDASNVISVTGGTGGGISSAECQTMIDQSISGKADSSTVDTLSGTVTANTADIATVSGNVNTISGDVATNTANIATVSAATASNTTALGGLKLVKLSQSEYDSLVTKDNSTLYVIVG